MRAKTLGVYLVLSILVGATAVHAGALTKPIRLIAEEGLDWSGDPQPVAVSGSLTIEYDDPDQAEKASKLKESMDGWTVKAFEQLKYTVDDGAPLHYHYTIDFLDWGSTGKQLLIGAGAGLAEGTIVLTQGDEEVGRFRYSAKVRIFGGAGKQIAPPLVLKLHKGERDEELHERRAKAQS